MKLLSKQEAADQLGLCRATVHKLIKTEELPARRVGGQIRIDPDELASGSQRVRRRRRVGGRLPEKWNRKRPRCHPRPFSLTRQVSLAKEHRRQDNEANATPVYLPSAMGFGKSKCRTQTDECTNAITIQCSWSRGTTRAANRLRVAPAATGVRGAGERGPALRIL